MKKTSNSGKTVVGFVVFTGFVSFLLICGCSSYNKVPVTYRQLPAVENLSTRTLLIGPFYQKSSGFQAVTDLVRILQGRFQKDQVFKDVFFTLDIREIPEEQIGIKESIGVLASTKWPQEKFEVEADFLLTGAVLYNARDRSGYDSEWKLDQYGYRVPRKVYRDRLAFDLQLGLLLVDLKTGEIIINQTLEDNGVAEGAADEIGIYFDLIDKQLGKFLDELRGKRNPFEEISIVSIGKQGVIYEEFQASDDSRDSGNDLDYQCSDSAL